MRRLSPGKALDAPGSQPGPLAPSHIMPQKTAPCTPGCRAVGWGQGRLENRTQKYYTFISVLHSLELSLALLPACLKPLHLCTSLGPPAGRAAWRQSCSPRADKPGGSQLHRLPSPCETLGMPSSLRASVSLGRRDMREPRPPEQPGGTPAGGTLSWPPLGAGPRLNSECEEGLGPFS